MGIMLAGTARTKAPATVRMALYFPCLSLRVLCAAAQAFSGECIRADNLLVSTFPTILSRGHVDKLLWRHIEIWVLYLLVGGTLLGNVFFAFHRSVCLTLMDLQHDSSTRRQPSARASRVRTRHVMLPRCPRRAPAARA